MNGSDVSEPFFVSEVIVYIYPKKAFIFVFVIHIVRVPLLGMYPVDEVVADDVCLIPAALVDLCPLGLNVLRLIDGVEHREICDAVHIVPGGDELVALMFGFLEIACLRVCDCDLRSLGDNVPEVAVTAYFQLVVLLRAGIVCVAVSALPHLPDVHRIVRAETRFGRSRISARHRAPAVDKGVSVGFAPARIQREYRLAAPRIALDTVIAAAVQIGVHKVYPEIDMYAKMSESKHPQVFDVLSCEFGCNVGPGTGNTQTVFDDMATMRTIEAEAKSRRKSSGLMGRGEDRLFKKFDEELRLADFFRTYKPSMPSPIPTEAQLEPIFEKMGQHTPNERKYDCHACGYNSCREMAIAIFRGLNTPSNCIVHAKSVLLARHSALTKQHERLSEIAAECLEMSAKLKTDIVKINDSVGNINTSTSATEERATVVKDLLENVVEFCRQNPKMDEDSVEQLTGILETTIDAFSSLDDNVNITKESSDVISNSISGITKLIEDINATLVKTEETHEKKDAKEDENDEK